MIRVKLSTNFPEWPLIRQTPDRAGLWGECKFFINEEIDECDFWVVYDDVVRPETTRCPPSNTLLITGEPPSVKCYHPSYTAQFACVLTCQLEIHHPNVITRQQALPWMIGCRYHRETKEWDKAYGKDYDELAQLQAVPKTKRLSVLSSDKAFTPGHARRLAFVKALQAYFGDEIDVFGRGIRDVEDKGDAIALYKYHIVIENGQFPDYFTEKLTDAIFADAYPLYAGCPNIGDYFPKDALTVVDITDPAAGIQAICAAMETNRYESSREARQVAKKLLLNEYNLFPTLEAIILASSRTAPREMIQLRPQSRFSTTLLARVKNKVKNKFRQIYQ